MKLGSLFDGSGGFPLAGTLCGIEPVWASEVEPYPIAVTRSRFPKMKHLGDISKINGAEIEPVDIITFGSPCQDLSVAGKRAGLKHEDNGDEETTRSGLFMEAVRIIKEMRNATNGEYPSFALWENVPGAFSSNKGEDFRIVLEELVKIVEPTAVMPSVPQNGWPYADSYRGDGWSLAYRVFDAQYWGVPQRRRRIHLVLDLRGERAKEILFEREGVRGYFATGGTPWKAVTSDAERSPGADDRKGASDVIPINTMLATRHKQLGRGTGFGIGEVGEPQFTISSAHEHAVAYAVEATGLDCYNQSLTGDKAKALTNAATDSDHIPCVVCGLDGYNAATTGDVSATLGVNCGMSTGRNGVIETIPYTLKIRSGCEGGGKGALIQEDLSATLATNNDQYLFQPVAYSFDSLSSNSMKSANPHSGCREVEVSKCLDTTNPDPSKNQGGIAIVCKTWDARGNGDGDICNTITGDHENRITDYTSVICLQGNGIDRADTAGCNGRGWNEKTCYTLNTIDRPAVAYLASGKEAVGTLLASMATKQCLGDQEAFSGDYHIIEERDVVAIDRAAFNQGQNAQYEPQFYTDGTASTIVARGPSAVAYVDTTHADDVVRLDDTVAPLQARDYKGGKLVQIRYIVRRLTPTECARLQGFADRWGDIEEKADFTDEEYAFWFEVRNTHAAINGKATKEYTKEQMVKWYNKLHTDSAEYKMWGNGIALPPALYCMQGITEAVGA